MQTLLITGLNLLTDLRGLENVASFTEVSILNNPQLRTLRHFAANVPSNHRITVTSVGIRDNHALEDVSGFSHVQEVTGRDSDFVDYILVDCKSHKHNNY